MAKAAKVPNWDKKIAKAEKFLLKSREHGRKVYSRYEDNREEEIIGYKRINLFYANVNTVKESLFNSMPKPDVSRLHKGDVEDDVARVAAMLLQRALTYEVECCKNFSEAIVYAILDRLVPGTGQVWVRFEKPEQLFVDVVYWEDFIYGPARCWDLVPWVGRVHNLDKEDFIEIYGKEGFEKAEAAKNDDSITPKEISEGKYKVYEIWNKKDKKVYHVVRGADSPLKTLDDPYKLPDFFPCPQPLIANATTTKFLAITDYHLAQDQYNEIDTLYARMSMITKAVKVAGAYDSAATEISKMLEGMENKLIPVDNWAMYAERGGAKGLIDWYPVENVVAVYQALQSQFETVKGALYEVSGMSDIMRGDSNQYETAAAQQIKAQFASVRMNGYQRDVSHFVRNILNIMAQLMCKLYSDDKFKQIVGTFTEADQQYLAPAAQVLRNDILRMYKVDIEADSLTQADWALEKGQRMELTGYISQFLTAAMPAIEQVPEIGPLMVGMLKFSIAGYKGSAELEGILDQQMAALEQKAQNPQPKPPSPEETKAQLDQQKMQMQAQIDQQTAATNAQLKEKESEQKMAIQQQKMEHDVAVQQMEMEHTRELHELQMRMAEMELNFKHQEEVMKLQAQQVSGDMKTEHLREQGDIKNDQARDKAKSNGAASASED